MSTLKCNVCGLDFPATMSGHYIARDNGKTGMKVIVGYDEEQLYDAFDCPACGCQLIVQARKRMFATMAPFTTSFGDDDDEQDQDTEDDDVHTVTVVPMPKNDANAEE